MGLTLRIFLVVGAALVLLYVILKLRKARINVADTVFWTLLCALLVAIAIFPEIIYWCSDLLGINSPANFVFLCTIALLLIRILVLNMRLATLRKRFDALVGRLAIDEKVSADKMQN